LKEVRGKQATNLFLATNDALWALLQCTVLPWVTTGRCWLLFLFPSKKPRGVPN